MLEIELGTSCVPSVSSTTELYPNLAFVFFFNHHHPNLAFEIILWERDANSLLFNWILYIFPDMWTQD